MALVRYVLAKENMLDIGNDQEKNGRIGEGVREILLEAAVRLSDE